MLSSQRLRLACIWNIVTCLPSVWLEVGDAVGQASVSLSVLLYKDLASFGIVVSLSY